MIKMKLTTPKVNIDWWPKARKEATDLIEQYNKESWAAQRDPVTLKPWTPRKSSVGSWPILRKTGLMQDTAKFKASSTPFDIKVKTTNYGPFHQYGTSKMPQRRWLGIGGSLVPSLARVISKGIFKGKTVTRVG